MIKSRRIRRVGLAPAQGGYDEGRSEAKPVAAGIADE